MAYGNSVLEPNYVCTKSGKYMIKDDKGKTIEHFFHLGDKVYLESAFIYCMDANCKPSSARWRKININMTEEYYYEYDEDYWGEYKYIDKTTVKNLFRPINHKHLETKEFEDVKSMNEFLLNLPIDNLKDVKMNDNKYLVIFINKEDD